MTFRQENSSVTNIKTVFIDYEHEMVNNFKYLGVILTTNKKNIQIEEKIQSASKDQ